VDKKQKIDVVCRCSRDSVAAKVLPVQILKEYLLVEKDGVCVLNERRVCCRLLEEVTSGCWMAGSRGTNCRLVPGQGQPQGQRTIKTRKASSECRLVRPGA
jgi:hypothetical protein